MYRTGPGILLLKDSAYYHMSRAKTPRARASPRTLSTTIVSPGRSVAAVVRRTRSKSTAAATPKTESNASSPITVSSMATSAPAGQPTTESKAAELVWLFLLECFAYARSCSFAAIFVRLIFEQYCACVTWLANAGLGDRGAFTLLACSVHTFLYLVQNTFYLIASRPGGMLHAYKIPRKPSHEPSSQLIRETVITGVVMQLTVQPLTMYYVVWPAFQFFGAPSSIVAALPPLTTMFWQFVFCTVFNEVLFYWSHRMLHTFPELYVRIHKQHHTYHGSIGFAAEYASPIEQIVSNQLPTAGGAILLGVHPLVWCVWLAWRLVQTYETHSGLLFDFPVLRWLNLVDHHATQWHDDHHAINTGNYGSALLDTLFGTVISSNKH